MPGSWSRKHRNAGGQDREVWCVRPRSVNTKHKQDGSCQVATRAANQREKGTRETGLREGCCFAWWSEEALVWGILGAREAPK